MKRVLLAITIFSLSMGRCSYANNSPFKLSADVIQYLDTPYAINAAILEVLLHIKYKVNSLVGYLPKEKAFQYHVNYRGKDLTIKEFAEVEAKGAVNHELDGALVMSKNLLEEMLLKFMDQALRHKNVMVTLIEESCLKRNRPDSLLLDWVQTKEGEETKIFHERVTSFAELEVFCSDLANFLSDLIYSCPKAQEKYKLMRKKEILTREIDHIVASMKLDAKRHEELISEFSQRLEADRLQISATPQPAELAKLSEQITEYLTKKK